MRPGGGLPCTLTRSHRLLHRLSAPPPHTHTCTKLPPWPVCTRGHCPPSSPLGPTQWAHPAQLLPGTQPGAPACPHHTHEPPPGRTAASCSPPLSPARAAGLPPARPDPGQASGGEASGSCRAAGRGGRAPRHLVPVPLAALVMGVIDLCLGAAPLGRPRPSPTGCWGPIAQQGEDLALCVCFNQNFSEASWPRSHILS